MTKSVPKLNHINLKVLNEKQWRYFSHRGCISLGAF